MEVALAYDIRSQLIDSFNASALSFAANVRRAPVAFRGVVQEPLLMRQLMVAMHEIIVGDMTWGGSSWVLDPVITVHPDEVFYEAFSGDGSAYVRLAVKTEGFELIGQPTYGTTNVDFTFALREAMLNLRSARQTTFTVGAGGFGVETTGTIRRGTHFEEKVDVPDNW